MTDLSMTGHFSEPAAANRALARALSGKDHLLAAIPSMSLVLKSLLDELDQPADSVNLLRVAEIISRDESLAAQYLRMASSVLFTRGPGPDSIRGAVRLLGFARTREIAVSCGLMRVLPSSAKGLDPTIFWQHSLACAIVARKLARAVGFGDPDKAYLAGLLHDLGYIVTLIIFPQQTAAVIAKSQQEGLFLGEVEYSQFGFTHCQTGELLARQWKLPEGLVEVILCHHDVATAVINPALVAIVSLSDRLCRAANLGIGNTETLDPMDAWEADWAILLNNCPYAADMTWGDFVKDATTYVEEIRTLVASICKGR